MTLSTESESPWRENVEQQAENGSSRVEAPQNVEVPEPAGERGYRDLTDGEFRSLFRDDYLEPMNRGTARIERFSDPRETVSLVNPDYETGSSYKVNCCDAARCFERTWRGHAEEAAGKAYQLTEGAGEGLYVEGEPSSRTELWAGSGFDGNVAPEEVRHRLTELGPGASAIVHSRWVDESGDVGNHAYNVVNHQGRITVVDAQTSEVLKFSSDGIRPGFGPESTHLAMLWNQNGDRVHV